MRIITLCAGLLLGTVLGATAQAPTPTPLSRWQHLLAAPAPLRAARPAPVAAAARGTRGPAGTLASRSPRAAALPTQLRHHYWTSTTNSWLKCDLEAYGYDSQGRLTTQTFADSATNVPTYRSLYAYDAYGHNVMEQYQRWDGAAWADEQRYLATYDTHGGLTEELYQDRVGNAWQTQGGYRYTLAYTPTHVLTEQVTQRWDNGTFKNEERISYTVSAAGEWSELTQQMWDNGQWVNEARFINLTWRNFSKQEISSFTEQEWQGQWDDLGRATFTWGANDSYVALFETPLTPTTWKNESRTTVTNDSHGQQTLELYEVWDGGAWREWSGYRSLLRYSATGDLLRRLDQEMDATVSPAYVNSDLYLYSNFVVLAARQANRLPAAEAYPNPTTGRLQLRWAGAAHSGTLLNALGQPVQALPVAPGARSCTLDLGSLPAGVYTVRLQTADGVVSQRVVRQ